MSIAMRCRRESGKKPWGQINLPPFNPAERAALARLMMPPDETIVAQQAMGTTETPNADPS